MNLTMETKNQVLAKISQILPCFVVFGQTKTTSKKRAYAMVVSSLWAVEMTRVMRKVPHLGVWIVWGTIPSGLPVFWIIVPGCSRNSYGTSPNLWVQKKLVEFWQGTQVTWLSFAKFLREFLSYSPFDLLTDQGDVILSWFRVKFVLCSTASTAIRRFFQNWC